MIVAELITDKGLYGRQPSGSKMKWKTRWIDNLLFRKFKVMGFKISDTDIDGALCYQMFDVPEMLYRKKTLIVSIDVSWVGCWPKSIFKNVFMSD